jgi:hypothetical protein
VRLVLSFEEVPRATYLITNPLLMPILFLPPSLLFFNIFFISFSLLHHPLEPAPIKTFLKNLPQHEKERKKERKSVIQERAFKKHDL